MKLWHTDIDLFSDEWYWRTVKQLPEPIFSEIDRYHSMNDKKSRLLARLLIRFYCSTEGYDWNWSNWKKEENHKPFLENGPFFNISHAGKKVVVVFSEKHTVGVDVEQIAAIDVNAMSSYFHPAEITFLQQKHEEAFFTIWTRKEALLKAVGIGILNGLNQVSVLDDELYYNGTWFLKECTLFDAYKVSICSSSAIQELHFKEIDTIQLNSFIDEKILL